MPVWRLVLARAQRVELSGGVYHVIARGNERKAIFRDTRDREIYLERLADCRDRLHFRVLAYCLMGNHLHLALERGPVALSRVMLALQSFYSQKFNFRHRRVGHLFQGRYKAFLVQKERHLIALVRYIHLNPVRAGIVERPEGYPWSSDRFYRNGSGPAWLDMDRVLGMLSTDRRRAILVYRRLMTKAELSPYEEVAAHGRAIKGERRFAERTFLAVGSAVRLPSEWTAEKLAEAVARIEGLPMGLLRGPRGSLRESRVRLIAAYLGRYQAGIPIARMATYFGREESTFSRGVKRLEESMERDPAIASSISEIASALRIGSTGIHD